MVIDRAFYSTEHLRNHARAIAGVASRWYAQTNAVNVEGSPSALPMTAGAPLRPWGVEQR
jgi:hypothetical protein